LWLYNARKGNGQIRADEKYLAKKLPFRGRVKLQPLMDAGFITLYQDDSTLQAKRYARDRGEGETETETEESISYDENEKCFKNISPERMIQWEEAFPAVDIELDLKNAALWVVDNPTKKKTQWGRFLTNWFRRTQERGGNKGSTAAPKKTKLYPIAGKTCENCKLPAVYKDTSGSYDHYYCLDHAPTKVKEKYE
jgi:hypothetical protein